MWDFSFVFIYKFWNICLHFGKNMSTFWNICSPFGIYVNILKKISKNWNICPPFGIYVHLLEKMSNYWNICPHFWNLNIRYNICPHFQKCVQLLVYICPNFGNMTTFWNIRPQNINNLYYQQIFLSKFQKLFSAQGYNEPARTHGARWNRGSSELQRSSQIGSGSRASQIGGWTEINKKDKQTNKWKK